MDPAAEYRRLTIELRRRRREGILSQAEEAKWAAMLTILWRYMTSSEQQSEKEHDYEGH